MKLLKLFLIFFIVLISLNLHSGFAAGTLVKLPDGYTSIEKLIPGNTVCSFDQQNTKTISKIKTIISYTSSEAILFEFGNEILIAAPCQKYYTPTHANNWPEAEKVNSKTTLCNLSGQSINLQKITHLHDKITFFDIQLENNHTFCVTKQDIVVHNFPPFFIGLSFAWGGGVVFNGICGGLCVAGVWLGTKIFKKNSDKNNSDLDVQVTASCSSSPDPDNVILYNQNDKSLDAQAPGKPTESDGYIPPKNWDGEKVKNPNGHGYGWPDEKGNVWIPSGPNGHGGPHWDVQHPGKGKKYTNIVPGGRKRGKK